jgi:hypothetical protein
MKGTGYLMSTGAFLALAIVSSPWWLLGLVAVAAIWSVAWLASRPRCDCLIGRATVRLGGAVYGCPVHDPGHTAERREALKEARRHAPGN